MLSVRSTRVAIVTGLRPTTENTKMSVETQESVYNLIPPRITQAEARRRHRSRFSEMVQQETKHLKGSSKTMGPAKVPVNKPEEYLKKHSKEVKISPTKPTAKKLPEDLTAPRKPRVPTLHDKPQMAAKTNKDFIKTNAISTITAVPKKPQPKYVDSPKGTSFPLEESGLLPHYINKKTYGKVPIYLETRRNEMAEAQAEYEKYIRESFEREQMVQISGEERKLLLEGLKKNWDQIHHEYQGLSVVTDTPSKKARKERMESEMKQLEKDIELIEKHPTIYVENIPAY